MPEEYYVSHRDPQEAGEGAVYPTAPSTGSVSRFFLAVLVLLVVFGGIAQAVHFEWGMLFTQWGIVLLPALWYWKRHGFSRRGLARLKPLEGKYLPTIFLLGFCAWTFNMLVALSMVRFLMSFGYDPIALIVAPATLAQLAGYLLVLAFSAGICEEILFRGTIMPALENQGVIPALLFSSLLFAIMHVSFTNLAGTFLLGVLFGVAVIKTGSLLAGMTFHMLNNTIAVCFLYLSTRIDLDTFLASIDGVTSLILILVSLGGLVMGLIRLQNQSGGEPLLKGRSSWLPRGWFNWAVLLAFVVFFLLGLLELLMGFDVI